MCFLHCCFLHKGEDRCSLTYVPHVLITELRHTAAFQGRRYMQVPVPVGGAGELHIMQCTPLNEDCETDIGMAQKRPR